MINEACKLGIAIDLIEDKIAKKMIEKRNCSIDVLQKIEHELEEILYERDEIYKGNYEFINKIIKEKEDEKND